MASDIRNRIASLTGLYALHGAEHFVEKCGRQWTVVVEGSATPTLFRTKREAVAHAEARVSAVLERLRQEAA